MKPHIKRTRLKRTGAWMWGMFRTQASLLPYAMAPTVHQLSEVAERWHQRHSR